MVDTSDEWIRARSGIRERRIAAADEATSDLAVQAARRALEDAATSPSEIDLLIVATVTPDYAMPATACIVQHKLGLPTDAACFDLNAACSGFIYGLDVACALIGVRPLQEGPRGRRGEALLHSRLEGPRAPACSSGTGRARPSWARAPGRASAWSGRGWGPSGRDTDLLYIPAGGSRYPSTSKSIAKGDQFIKMKGKEVFKLAVRLMEEAARDILEQHGLAANQIGLVIPHQANLRIIEAIAQYLELPIERFFVNVDRYGNTSAASIPSPSTRPAAPAGSGPATSPFSSRSGQA